MQNVVLSTRNIDDLVNDLADGVVKKLQAWGFQLPANQLPSQTGTATRRQAADHLNISLPTLADYTKSGKVKGQRIGRRVLYRWADLDAALTAIKTEGGSK